MPIYFFKSKIKQVQNKNINKTKRVLLYYYKFNNINKLLIFTILMGYLIYKNCQKK